MNYEEIRSAYGEDILDRIFDIMFNAPVHELIEDILIRMSDKELEKWVTILKQEEKV